MMQSRKKKTNTVKSLLKLGEDPNEQSNNKQTPLHWAARKGYLCIAENLLAFGARVDLKDDVDFDPLLFASLNGHNKMVKLLLQYGSDINSKDKKGYTSLYAAAFKMELIKMAREMLLNSHQFTVWLKMDTLML